MRFQICGFFSHSGHSSWQNDAQVKVQDAVHGLAGKWALWEGKQNQYGYWMAGLGMEHLKNY